MGTAEVSTPNAAFSGLEMNHQHPVKCLVRAKTLSLRAIACIFMLNVGDSIHAAGPPVFTFSKITSEADVLNTGIIVRATNLGKASEGTFNPVTVNGILFGTNTAGMTGWDFGGGDFSTEFPVGSPLDQLLSGTWYATGGTSSLTLSGLTAGKDYTFQMFLANAVNSTGYESRITIQGQAFNLTGKYNGLAHSLQIDFTAGGSSQAITFGTGSTYGPERMQFNGFYASDRLSLANSIGRGITSIELPINDLVFDPVSDRILASVPSGRRAAGEHDHADRPAYRRLGHFGVREQRADDVGAGR